VKTEPAARSSRGEYRQSGTRTPEPLTSPELVVAAGEILSFGESRSGTIRVDRGALQLKSSADVRGTGCMAALLAERFLHEQHEDH
jgi:hypothetical protein